MAQRRTHLEWATAILVSICVGVVTLAKIWENDIFVYLRLGKELLAFRPITTDHWTFSIFGQHWCPQHWGSYLLIGLIERLGGYSALSVAQGFFISLWVFSLAVILMQTMPRSRLRFAILALLPIVVFLICQWRIYFRADFFASFLFMGLILIWQGNWTSTKKVVYSLFVLLLWSNFHGGTFPLGCLFFIASVFTAEDLSFKRKCAYSLAATMTWFLNPSGFEILQPFLYITFFYGERLKYLSNPDWAHFTPSLLEFKYGAWSYVLWITYTGLGSCFLIWALMAKRMSLLRGPYRHWIFSLTIGVFLTVFSFRGIRGILFQVPFILPVVGCSLGHLSQQAEAAKKLWRWTLALGVLSCFIVGKVIPDNIFRFSNDQWGVGVNEDVVPVRAVNFLKTKTQPDRILNFMDFGGYLLSELPNYPIAFDGRDYPFTAFIKEWSEARRNRLFYSAFLNKYQVNIALEVASAESFQRNMRLYPSDKWALVFFDNPSALYLRRLPKYQTLIQQYEYHWIRREIPADDLWASIKAEKHVKEFGKEVGRCLADVPDDAYCSFMKAKVLEDDGRFPEALNYLNSAQRLEHQNPRVLKEKIFVLRKLGLDSEAKSVERWQARVL